MDRLLPKVTAPPSISRAQPEHHCGPQTRREVFLWGCRACRLEKAVAVSQRDENPQPGLEGPPCRSRLEPSILNCLCPSSVHGNSVHPALAMLGEREHHMLLLVKGSRAELHLIYLRVSPSNPYPWEFLPMPGITHGWWTMAWMNTWIEPGLITSLCVPVSLNWNIDFSTWMHNFEHWSLSGSTFPSVFWEEHQAWWLGEGKGASQSPFQALLSPWGLREGNRPPPPTPSRWGLSSCTHTQAGIQLSCVAVLVLGGRAPELGLMHLRSGPCLDWVAGSF